VLIFSALNLNNIIHLFIFARDLNKVSLKA